MLRQKILVVLVIFTIIYSLIIATSHTDEPRSPAFANQYPNIYVFETDENGNQQNLTLPCPIDAPSPTMNYNWFKGNQVLSGSMVNGEGSLIVPNITEGEYASREGVDYYCIASDNIGFNVAVRSRNITVYYAYFNGFERMAESDEYTIEVPISVALNSDVALKCDVLDANPPPTIKWCNDQGVVQEVTEGNTIRFLDGGRYLYLRKLKAAQLEQQYYCNVTNANLHLEISAPTRYVLIDNITEGVLIDYKQIGNVIAFVGNTSFEFAYVGGVFDGIMNETINTLTANGVEVGILGNIGIIHYTLSMPGMVHLEANFNYNDGIVMRSGTLTVYQVPRITNTIHDERDHLVGKESLTYTCQFEGFPLPNITFFHNGAVISPESGMTIVNNSLTIPSPQVSHSGIYQCIVSNEFGDDQIAWVLEIRQPILPNVRPLNFTELDAVDDRDLGALIVRDNGSIISFSVNVVADPCPNVVWILNSTALGPSNSTFIYNNACRAVHGRNSIWTFSLSMVLTSKTSGKFSANFTNIAGTAILLGAYFTVPVPTSITGLSLNDTCLKEGSSVSIRCNIRGFPRPSIEFRKGNTRIAPEAGMFDENILLEFYDQIVIKNVTMEDAGLYSCIVMEGQLQGIQRYDFCSLPRITGVSITSSPLIGELFFIECAVDGIPQPSTVWMKDGAPLEEIPNDDSIRIFTISNRKSSRVEIFSASIDDNGEYECIVGNIAGSVKHSFTIELMQAPTVQAGGSDVVPAPLSLGLIIGITVGVTVIISASLFVVLLLLCVICRLCVNDKSSKPQNAGTYSANVAYTGGTLEHVRELLEAIYPLYDTIPYSDPTGVQTNEKAQIYKRAHIYEKIYEDIQKMEQPSKPMTVNSTTGNVVENIPVDKIHVSENDDEDNTNGIQIEISHDEDNGKQGQKNPKIQNDDDEPSQIYASISAEHKAKKRRDRLDHDKESGQPKADILPYETVPDFTGPVQAQSEDEQDYNLVQTYEKAQIYERAQTYERINHGDTQLVQQLLSKSTREKSSGTDVETSSNI